ncbi:hypothetical protein PILCRDRAFT_15631 [Piloderma croceum F 1598]|uniref:DNA 3'-5' helicase n=1 Tax=Piloderma croceum (strain F 1598) TaxID=765440 RepID=A0A0C3EK15_PILCF|nr:hypothetical protein PILCRDRAFT_15631 [Piloderma croceum F 1598]
MVSTSKVRIFNAGEVNMEILVERALAVLRRSPFPWQLETAEAILRGEDVIIDVGTGSGKTLCFALPLLTNETDMVIVVSPLTALMVDQAWSAEVSTVPVCAETLASGGPDNLYKDILAGKFRQIVVSPEIAISAAFRTAVLSKREFSDKLRAVCIDEAHCISLWGGSFRTDYANLGVLRGRFPSNVPFIIASATLPDHILDDIQGKLKLSRNAKMVWVSNARPNIALSVRAMKFDNYLMANLRFLIPPKASKLEDIDITLVYCNQRTTCEDCVDRLRSWAHEMGIPPECIAFYHAKIGAKRKRELEEMLRKGQIQILVCTDAVGMGCDMRNIARVVLWGLPPSFCALVQRAGCTGRDFQTLGEAILIVPASVIKNGTKEAEVEQAVQDAVTENQAENCGDDEQTSLEENGIELAGGNQEVLVNDGGVRVEHDDSEPEEETSGKTQRRRKLSKNDTNSLEARYLTMFACAA